MSALDSRRPIPTILTCFRHCSEPIRCRNVHRCRNRARGACGRISARIPCMSFAPIAARRVRAGVDRVKGIYGRFSRMVASHDIGGIRGCWLATYAWDEMRKRLKMAWLRLSGEGGRLRVKHAIGPNVYNPQERSLRRETSLMPRELRIDVRNVA